MAEYKAYLLAEEYPPNMAINGENGSSTTFYCQALQGFVYMCIEDLRYAMTIVLLMNR